MECVRMLVQMEVSHMPVLMLVPLTCVDLLLASAYVRCCFAYVVDKCKILKIHIQDIQSYDCLFSDH